MSEHRLVEIESRLAYQDQQLHELNEVITKQQEKIMRLEELFGSIVERIRSLAKTETADLPPDERPPHY